MRIISLLLAITFFIETKASSTSTDAPTFKHHTFEFSITPAVDYHFVTYPSRSYGFKIQTNYLFLPFIGGNIGLAYTYRPVKYIGFSTGINYLEYVSRLGKLKDIYNMYVFEFWLYNGYSQQGYLGVPILIHAYSQVKRIEIDFASGPEFSFPIYTVIKCIEQVLGTESTQTQLFSTTAMAQQSFFGWNVQLTTCIPIKNLFSISIGPELKFISAKPLDAKVYDPLLYNSAIEYGNYPPPYSTSSRQVNYYAGIKVCFKLASNFTKKISSTHN